MSSDNVVMLANTVSLNGAITFYNAPELCARLLQILPKDQALTVDLKHVTKCDSASIVVLLQIIRFATQHQQTVKFVDMPKAMRVLSDLYDLNTLFKIKN
jgi:ABC-type transporter Mla MlaB component